MVVEDEEGRRGGDDVVVGVGDVLDEQGLGFRARNILPHVYRTHELPLCPILLHVAAYLEVERNHEYVIGNYDIIGHSPWPVYFELLL